MNGYYEKLAEVLRAHHFKYIRPGKGSHQIWAKGSIVLTVPFNCASRHTANGILKDAGIRHRF